MVNWARLPAGSSFQLHYHEDMQEVFVLLKGCVSRWTACATKKTTMEVGDTIIVDACEPHQMFNPGNEDAEYLVFLEYRPGKVAGQL